MRLTTFKDQKFEEAQKAYESLIAQDPGNKNIVCGLLRCLIQLNKLDEANEILLSLDDESLKNEEIIKIQKLLNSQVDEKGSNIEDLKSIVAKNPQDLEKRFELAEKYLQIKLNKALMELLYLFDQDPNWKEEAAKKKLLEYFDLLGFDDPNVMEARKKLSSLMFK